MNHVIHALPGTMCNEKLWCYLIEELPNDIELRHVCIPNFKSFDEIAEHIMRTIGSQPLNLLGFSLGGYVASFFANKYPEAIKRLFVVANSPTQLSKSEVQQRQDSLTLVSKFGYRGMPRAKATAMLDESRQREALIDCILAMDSDLGESTLVSQYQHTTKREDLAGAFKNALFPSSFYFCEEDALVDTDWLATLARDANTVKLIQEKGSGHMLPLEQPKALARHLESWLNSSPK